MIVQSKFKKYKKREKDLGSEWRSRKRTIWAELEFEVKVFAGRMKRCRKGNGIATSEAKRSIGRKERSFRTLIAKKIRKREQKFNFIFKGSIFIIGIIRSGTGAVTIFSLIMRTRRRRGIIFFGSFIKFFFFGFNKLKPIRFSRT